MKMLGKSCVLAAMVVTMFLSCANNANNNTNTGNEISTRTLSSSADIYVLGSYGNASNGILTFNGDGTGSYTAASGTSNSSRAASDSISKFAWTAFKGNSGTKITINYGGKTGTLERTGDGQISGKLDDANNITITPLDAVSLNPDEYYGVKCTLISPSMTELDRRLPTLGFCPTSIKFHANEQKADIFIRRAYQNGQIVDLEQPIESGWELSNGSLKFLGNVNGASFTNVYVKKDRSGNKVYVVLENYPDDINLLVYKYTY